MSRLLILAAVAAAFAVGLAPTSPTLHAADPKPTAKAAEANGFFFKPNDRIVFLGDSITTL